MQAKGHTTYDNNGTGTVGIDNKHPNTTMDKQDQDQDKISNNSANGGNGGNHTPWPCQYDNHGYREEH
jgi:hypothetical protein